MSFLVAISLDLALLDTIFRRYTADIEVEDDEVDEYRDETLGDLVNIVMGQVTTDLEVVGAILTVSPPIVFADSRQVRRPMGAKFCAASLLFDGGSIRIGVIGPPELFDLYLKERR